MLGSLADTALDRHRQRQRTLVGVRIAAQPADLDHRFGHGKAEALVALAQVVLISVSAIGIAWRAADRLINGGQTAAMDFGIAVSLLAIARDVGLAVVPAAGDRANRINRNQDRQRLHYKSDLMLNGAVILARCSIRRCISAVPMPCSRSRIALWLAWGAYRASNEAINQLMDREWPEDERQAFLKAMADLPSFPGLHDFAHPQERHLALCPVPRLGAGRMDGPGGA